MSSERLNDEKMENQSEFETILFLKQIIFSLNEVNFTQSANTIFNKFDENYPISFNLIINQMIYTQFVLKNNNPDIYLNFLKEIKALEEKNGSKINIIDEFISYLLSKQIQEANYLLYYMNKQKLFEPNLEENKSNPYFSHYMSKKEIKALKFNKFMKQILKNYDELSKNDWELHKKLIEEGVNPNKIAKIIRNDEIKQLQEISSQTNFDFNQYIKLSPYERCSFVGWEYIKVSLIDYAAFFGSIKCFKYLLMNNADVNNTGKYAVAGGNEEIIHLCVQNHSSFEGAYETAIKFHQNDIFKYLYENKFEKIKKLETLSGVCICYHNYEIFNFLLEEGMKINNNVINNAARYGNLYLVKYFLKENQIPINILAFSANSNNIELIKYVLEHEGIDVNAKNIYLFYLIFILIILYFKIIFGNYLIYLIQHFSLQHKIIIKI